MRNRYKITRRVKSDTSQAIINGGDYMAAFESEPEVKVIKTAIFDGYATLADIDKQVVELLVNMNVRDGGNLQYLDTSVKDIDILRRTLANTTGDKLPDDLLRYIDGLISNVQTIRKALVNVRKTLNETYVITNDLRNSNKSYRSGSYRSRLRRKAHHAAQRALKRRFK